MADRIGTTTATDGSSNTEQSLEDKIMNDQTVQQLAGTMNLEQLTEDFIEYREQALKAGHSSQEAIIAFVMDAVETEAIINDLMDDYKRNTEKLVSIFDRMYELSDSQVQDEANPDATTKQSSPYPLEGVESQTVKGFTPSLTAPTNTDRSEWADAVIQTFMNITGVDREDALADLLCDLMHWCDSSEFDFNDELSRGKGHYQEEVISDK